MPTLQARGVWHGLLKQLAQHHQQQMASWCLNCPAPRLPVLVTLPCSVLVPWVLPLHMATCSCLNPVCLTTKILDIMLLKRPFYLKCFSYISFLIWNPNLIPMICIHWSWLDSTEIHQESWASHKLIKYKCLSLRKKTSLVKRSCSYCSDVFRLLVHILSEPKGGDGRTKSMTGLKDVAFTTSGS